MPETVVLQGIKWRNAFALPEVLVAFSIIAIVLSGVLCALSYTVSCSERVNIEREVAVGMFAVLQQLEAGVVSPCIGSHRISCQLVALPLAGKNGCKLTLVSTSPKIIKVHFLKFFPENPASYSEITH